MSNAVAPMHFQPGEGRTFKIGRMTMTFKTSAGPNWNAYTVCEAMEPPESGACLERHGHLADLERPAFSWLEVLWCHGVRHIDLRLNQDTVAMNFNGLVLRIGRPEC